MSCEEGKAWMEEGRLERGVAKGSTGGSIEVTVGRRRVRLEWPIRNSNLRAILSIKPVPSPLSSPQKWLSPSKTATMISGTPGSIRSVRVPCLLPLILLTVCRRDHPARKLVHAPRRDPVHRRRHACRRRLLPRVPLRECSTRPLRGCGQKAQPRRRSQDQECRCPGRHWERVCYFCPFYAHLLIPSLVAVRKTLVCTSTTTPAFRSLILSTNYQRLKKTNAVLLSYFPSSASYS
jgi:hypothetical protein